MSSQGGVGRSSSVEFWGSRVPSGFILVVVMEGGALEVGEPFRAAERSAAMSRRVLWVGGVREGWERGIGSFGGFLVWARRSLLLAIMYFHGVEEVDQNVRYPDVQ